MPCVPPCWQYQPPSANVRRESINVMRLCTARRRFNPTDRSRSQQPGKPLLTNGKVLGTWEGFAVGPGIPV